MNLNESGLNSISLFEHQYIIFSFFICATGIQIHSSKSQAQISCTPPPYVLRYRRIQRINKEIRKIQREFERIIGCFEAYCWEIDSDVVLSERSRCGCDRLTFRCRSRRPDGEELAPGTSICNRALRSL